MSISQRKRERLEALARLVRSYVLRATTAAGSGHPTSCLSATDLMVTLMFGGHFRADLGTPTDLRNDRLIFSKGHAAPLLYSLYTATRKVSERELLSLRKFGSRLEGHPTLQFPYTAVPTGSLGQGLSIGLGMGIAASTDRLAARTWVLLGDSEMAEGSNWEAIQLAGKRRTANLVGIIDMNRLGQSGATMLGYDTRTLAKRIAAFGWQTLVIDGHDLGEIDAALTRATAAKSRPTMIVARTVKGKGVAFLENKNGWHGRALTEVQLTKALVEIGPVDRTTKGAVVPPPKKRPRVLQTRRALAPHYEVGKQYSTRKAIGIGLVRVARQYPTLTVLDGDVKNSTYTELFERKHPDRFIQCYIAEQNMAGIAQGLAARGKIPLAVTFAAFWSRAFDQLRMAQYTCTPQVYVGTHAGVSIGEDGPSQMGLEDIAEFRSLYDCTILYPADAYAAERLLELALKGPCLTYLRASRPNMPILYGPRTEFRVGGSHTLRSTRQDQITIVAAGITLFEALEAADQLDREGVSVRVIDLYSVQPLDAKTLRAAARQTGHLVVVEDHVRPGGMAEGVMSALGKDAGTVTSLAVTKTPRSGTTQQLLHHQGIDADGIARCVRKLLYSGEKRPTRKARHP